MTERNEVQRGGPQSGSSVYEYDPNLPYVVTIDGVIQARFRSYSRAGEHAADLNHFRARVIDTTPKPRVPDAARFITWLGHGSSRWYAEKLPNGTWLSDCGDREALEDLPGVTPDTVFTVLDERKQ